MQWLKQGIVQLPRNEKVPFFTVKMAKGIQSPIRKSYAEKNNK